jgi:hypothetical protein
MKRLLQLTIAGLIFSTMAVVAQPAKAQSDIQIVMQLVCGLLAPNDQRACMNEFSTHTGPNTAVMQVCSSLYSSSSIQACHKLAIDTQYVSDEALNVCSSFYSESKKVDCISNVREKYYDTNALNVCTSFYSESSKLSCMNSIANNQYSNSALNVCTSFYSESKKLECLKVVTNKEYVLAETSACTQLYSESQKLQCLSDFGRSTGHGQIVIKPLPPIVSIPVPVRDTCEVTNSTGRVLGTIDASNFYGYLADESVKNNQCIVGWQKNAQYSRILIDSRGYVLGEGLSETETNQLKKRNNLSRCQVRICEIR